MAVVGLAGKLELAPLDAPEADTELVAGALTEYCGRGLALFRLAKNAALVVGLALIAAFYLGGADAFGPLGWLAKTLVLLALRGAAADAVCPLAYRSDGRAVVAGRRLAGTAADTRAGRLEGGGGMKLGLMLGDLIGSLFRRPATVRYPASRTGPARLRGPVQWNRLKCTGCGVCVMDCPANALQLVTLDKSSKRFVLDYHLERCTFCSQCVQSCRQGALSMSNSDWELATANLAGLVLHYGEPEDVQRVLADRLASGASTGHSA